MRRILALSALMILFAALTACTSQTCPLHQGIKGAKIEIKNIENGTVVKITSDSPEEVAKIQEHCKQAMEPRTAGLLPCGKCPGKKKCWEKKAEKAK